jgi:phage recombination protein Bet
MSPKKKEEEAEVVEQTLDDAIAESEAAPKPKAAAQLQEVAVKDEEIAFALTLKKAERDLIRSHVASDATPSEFALFLYDAQIRGLNPLKNELYFVKRMAWNSVTKRKEPVASHQVAIDGYRILAERTGKYKGQTKVEFGDDMTFANETVPEWAEVGVYKEGFTQPVYGRVYFKEYAAVYNDKLMSMWARMPRHMIAKCAESLALRKAFPDTLAGINTKEEMSGMDRVEVRVVDHEDTEEAPEKPAPPKKEFADLGAPPA